MEPRCPHHGTCGGCAWQRLAYDAQATLKRDIVADAMRRVGKVRDATALVDKCEGAVETYGYRNRMEFAFATSTRDGSGVDVGLRPRGSNAEVVDLSAGCAIQSDEANAALMAVRETLRRLGGEVEAFDRTRGRGRSGAWTIRTADGGDGKRSVMVNLHTTAKDGELTEGPVAELVSDVSKVDAVSSVVHTSVPNEPSCASARSYIEIRQGTQSEREREEKGRRAVRGRCLGGISRWFTV